MDGDIKYHVTADGDMVQIEDVIAAKTTYVDRICPACGRYFDRSEFDQHYNTEHYSVDFPDEPGNEIGGIQMEKWTSIELENVLRECHEFRKNDKTGTCLAERDFVARYGSAGLVALLTAQLERLSASLKKSLKK